MPEPLKVDTLNIPSSLEQLLQVDETVERIAREMGFTDDARADLGICVTEAAGNAIVHAHHQQATILVEIRFERFTDSLRVVVRDHGPGFEASAVPDPTSPENLLKLHGRGLLVIRSLMDNVDLQRLPDGMQIVMVKHLSR
jgi:serine/threonine-protein kinase RsbW